MPSPFARSSRMQSRRALARDHPMMATARTGAAVVSLVCVSFPTVSS
jgi:hypothetical protein